MAIQSRRGPYNRFDPQKMVPGEWAIVLSGDTHASDGLACYMCFSAGNVKRMATYEDMIDQVSEASGSVVAIEVDKQCKAAIQSCQTATSDANSAVGIANTAISTANTAANEANTAKNNADAATINANNAADRANAYVLGDISGKTVTFSQATSSENIQSNESMSTIFSKIAKWFSDLGTAAFHGVSNVLTTTADGFVLDARQGKILDEKINGLIEQSTTEIKKTSDDLLNKSACWTSAPGSYCNMVKKNGFVTVDIKLMSNTTGLPMYQTLFTLPEGFRPNGIVMQRTSFGSAVNQINSFSLEVSGNVVPQEKTIPASALYYLTFSFWAAEG